MTMTDVAEITQHREEAKPHNLYQRLAAVRVALGGEIDKGGRADPSMGGYKFIAWDDVAEKIGGFMADAGVMMIPSERRTRIEEAGTTAGGKTIWRATVWLELELVNVDNPKDNIEITWVGVGDDTSDKSVQKAITSGVKYALLKLFLLAGADDSDASDVTSAPREGGAAPGVTPPPGRKVTSSGPIFKTLLQDGASGQTRLCPQCHIGQVEAALWDSGRVTMACTNWRECKWKENGSTSIMTAVRAMAVTAGIIAETPGVQPDDVPF
jgi:hypothetical protein